jgi:hypothetical protein
MKVFVIILMLIVFGLFALITIYWGVKGELGYVVLSWFATALYFLPTIVGKNHKNMPAIFVTNLFLGWTVIGWIIALIWACKVDINTTHQ